MEPAADLVRVTWSRMPRSDARAEEDSGDLRVSHGLSIGIPKEKMQAQIQRVVCQDPHILEVEPCSNGII
jgi:hypothetical protein